jgi:hypothetical protein
MTASPKVPTITLDSSLRGRSVEVDGRESDCKEGIDESSIIQHERWQKAKDLEEIR